jgi:hypothetical protein
MMAWSCLHIIFHQAMHTIAFLLQQPPQTANKLWKKPQTGTKKQKNIFDLLIMSQQSIGSEWKMGRHVVR